ncbi:MAG: hypothetical protein HYW25_04555 [Candidatus Aenigmarchaeota archaeon]|nr:hypothetical protein [Candidatus Aenigmarchaeota archaeon]
MRRIFASKDSFAPAAGVIFLLLIAVLFAVYADTSLNPSGLLHGGSSAPECSDHVDNDDDGYTDYNSDPGCSSATDASEYGNKCDNGINDDRDGLIDYPDDPGCSSIKDLNEYASPLVHCDNGVDDDKDGKMDWPADEQCENAEDKTEADDSCTDSDRGKSYKIKGAIYGINNDTKFNRTDYCTNATHLQEFFCSGMKTNQITSRCRYGCLSGGCKTSR